VFVVRDVTDRVRRIAVEKHALSAAVARQKDEETNRFTRHEVKNGVLAALSQCDALHAHHRAAVAQGALVDASSGGAMEGTLLRMRASLQNTLDAVLSHAMAKEVIHGLYVPRTGPTRLDDALQLGPCHAPRDARFPVRMRPCPLPTIDTDPQLLLHVFLNAKSNACKYGREDGIVATEVAVDGGELTLRVINEPGEYHDLLCGLPDPSAVFAKGTRFHAERSPLPTARTSTGDGAWIMQRCAECLQGSCTIAFEPSRTVFEMRCPVIERLDDALLDGASLGPTAFCLGVDDCEFQRFVLQRLLRDTGAPTDQVAVYGETAEELRNVAGTLVHLVRSLPGRLILAVIDENLDLPDSSAAVSGSHAIHQARQRLAPADEARLLGLVRSANDSPSDQALYASRAHGFLSKSPGPAAGHTAIIRAWVARFGTGALRKSGGAPGEEQPAVSTHVDASRAAAASELQKVVRQLEGWQTMTWSEAWKWLHRTKGILASAPGDGDGAQARRQALIARVEVLRVLDAFPADFANDWAELRRGVEVYAQLELAEAARAA